MDALAGDLEADRARALFERVVEIRKRMLGAEHPLTLMSLGNLSSTLGDLGQWDDARRLDEEVLDLRRKALGDHHPDTIIAMNNLANTLAKLGRHGMAKALEEEALDAGRRVLGSRHPDCSISAWGLFCTLGRLKENEARRELLRRDLLWLTREDPDRLGAVQRTIRGMVLKYLERYPIDEAES
jgi:hypothetical protein